MQQNEVLELVPNDKKNAITNYELALVTGLRVFCLNRMLKKLEKYGFVKSFKDDNRHYKSKKYYKIK